MNTQKAKPVNHINKFTTFHKSQWSSKYIPMNYPIEDRTRAS